MSLSLYFSVSLFLFNTDSLWNSISFSLKPCSSVSLFLFLFFFLFLSDSDFLSLSLSLSLSLFLWLLNYLSHLPSFVHFYLSTLVFSVAAWKKTRPLFLQARSAPVFVFLFWESFKRALGMGTGKDKTDPCPHTGQGRLSAPSRPLTQTWNPPAFWEAKEKQSPLVLLPVVICLLCIFPKRAEGPSQSEAQWNKLLFHTGLSLRLEWLLPASALAASPTSYLCSFLPF